MHLSLQGNFVNQKQHFLFVFQMPNFFEQSHDYGMYSQDLEFDNRLMGVKTK